MGAVSTPSGPPPLTRVVFAIDNLHRPNGIVTCVDLLAPRMRERGLDVDILCFGACDPELAGRHRVITAFPARRATHRMEGFARSKPLLKPLRRAVGALWWPLVAARLRRIAASWEPGTLVIGAGLESALLLSAAGARPPVMVCQVHEDVASLTPAQRDMVRRAAAVSHTMTALTPQGAQELRDWGLSAAFMANPAPPATARADVASSRTVVYLGRLARAKQVDHLIEAFAAVAPEQWRLRIYGAGPMEEALRAQAEATGKDIELCGTIEDVGPVLQGAAIHALSSRAEGLGMSVLEANMAGVPTVAYDGTPGIRLAAGPHAELVPNGDRAALSRALARLMTDEQARIEAGREASEHGRSFEAAAVVEQWVALWQRLAR